MHSSGNTLQREVLLSIFGGATNEQQSRH